MRTKMAQRGDNRPFREKYRIYIYPVILAWLLTLWIRPVISDGPAMQPGIRDGELIIVMNQHYSSVRGTPEFGQVVAFRKDIAETDDKGANTIRRVIGLPGDKIEIRGGKVYRNDKALKEDYISGATKGDAGPFLIGEDEVFIMSDNRDDTADSRDPEIGPLDMKLIRGDCAFSIWPLKDIGKVK
jgi:signal peptidase I